MKTKKKQKFWRTWWNNEVYDPQTKGKILRAGDIILEGWRERKRVEAVWIKRTCALCNDGYAYTVDREEDWNEIVRRYEERSKELLGKEEIVKHKEVEVKLKVIAISSILEADRKLLLNAKDEGLIEIYYIVAYEVVSVDGKLEGEELGRFIKKFGAVRWPCGGWHGGYWRHVLKGYNWIKDFI